MKKTLLAVAILASSTSVAYANNSGFYIGAQAGGSLLSTENLTNVIDTASESSSDYNGTSSSNSNNSNATSNLGSTSGFSAVGGINLGYDFNPVYKLPFRAEIAYTLRSKANSQTDWNDASLTGTANGETQTAPDSYSYLMKNKIKAGVDTLMLNGYYDLHTSSGFTPYITAGIGLGFRTLSANINTKISNSATSYTSENLYENISEADTNFAWRAGIGVAYEINSNWIIDLSATYVDAGKITANYNETYSSSQSSDSYSYSNSGSYKYTTSAALNSVDVLLGVRYTF